jgi:hypothetical protein
MSTTATKTQEDNVVDLATRFEAIDEYADDSIEVTLITTADEYEKVANDLELIERHLSGKCKDARRILVSHVERVMVVASRCRMLVKSYDHESLERLADQCNGLLNHSSKVGKALRASNQPELLHRLMDYVQMQQAELRMWVSVRASQTEPNRRPADRNDAEPHCTDPRSRRAGSVSPHFEFIGIRPGATHGELLCYGDDGETIRDVFVGAINANQNERGVFFRREWNNYLSYQMIEPGQTRPVDIIERPWSQPEFFASGGIDVTDAMGDWTLDFDRRNMTTIDFERMYGNQRPVGA